MIEVSIDGMSCAHCARHVHEALAALPGVVAVRVSLEHGNAQIDTSAQISDEAIQQALDEEGYQATAITRR